MSTTPRSTPPRSDAEDRRARALEEIEHAAAGSEVFGTGAFVRQARRASAHFSGADADPADRIEVWGRRVGRSLSMIALVGLVWYLATTYL
jgi:hypothetical protein